MYYPRRFLAGSCCVLVLLAGATDALGVTLGISSDGRFFTLDGVPTYLAGVSYYGAQSITTASFRTSDLDDMVANGFNWIRVWALWQASGSGENVSVVDKNGTIRATYMNRLKTLISECNSRGMIVDVTLFRGNSSSVAPENQTQHLACVRTVATGLLPYRSVYIDVANERDVGDARYVSLSECGQLIDAIKAIDPQRPCTASSGPNSQSEMGQFFTQAHMDFITPHLCRQEGCSAQTVSTVRQYITWMTNIGHRAPVHLQEPFRRGYTTYNPTVEDFFRDCSGAKTAEAAGWCLHNGATNGGRPYRSFDMSNSEGRLYSQWDSVEQQVTAGLYGQIGSNEVNLRRYQVEYAEQLAHQVGRKESLVWSAQPSLDAAGYLSYGPYIDTVPAGWHQVRWQLMIDNNTANNNVVAVLDVYSNGNTLASMSVHRQDFAAPNVWQTFTLGFTSTGQQDLEFRTYWTDEAYIKCDWVELSLAPPAPPVPPVIAEVSPDPDRALTARQYVKQLTLLQGAAPVTWSVVQGPAGTQVSSAGLVSGWTPTPADIGGTYTFEIKAANAMGDDAEQWYVRVFSRADLDLDGDVDQADFARLQTCFSGTGVGYEAGCAKADLDLDGDVDLSDGAELARCINGPGQVPGG